MPWTLAALLLSCVDRPLGPGDSSVEDSGDTGEVEGWTWSDCDLEPGTGDEAAECTWVDLPLDHDDPTAGTLPAMVKRRPGTGPGQVWVLHGGPGASAIDELAWLPARLLATRPDLSVYAVDHRGIGATARLGCPEQESDGIVEDAEWPDCVAAMQAEWGEALPLLTTRQSARDIGWLIEHLAEAQEPVFIYGGSYGTYLALRYLQDFPDQPTGVILDGISPPGRGFVGYDAGMSAIGEELMALCGEDAGCAGHFTEEPLAVAQGLIEKYDTGHCPALGTNGDFIRYFLGSMLFYDKVRDMVPATVFRLDRCSTDDVDTIVTLYYALNGALGQGPRLPVPPKAGNDGQGFSYGLFFHVALSEMWYAPGQVTETEVAAAWQELTMSTGLETWLAPKLDWWPVYDKDPLWGQVPAYTGPLLMLQGGLDPATVPEPVLELATHFTGPAQTLAFFPQGAHGLIDGSTLPDGSNCGEALFQAFLQEPQAELDLGCIAQTQGVQWDGYEVYNQYFMETDDIWGD